MNDRDLIAEGRRILAVATGQIATVSTEFLEELLDELFYLKTGTQEIVDSLLDSEVSSVTANLRDELDAARVRIARLHAELERLRQLVRNFATDEDDCDIDEDGDCIEHGFVEIGADEMCPFAEAKQLAAEWDTEEVDR